MSARAMARTVRVAVARVGGDAGSGAVRTYAWAGGAQLMSFVAALGLIIFALDLIGYDPGRIGTALWDGSLGSSSSLGVSLTEGVPIVLSATAVWLALKGGLFNVGADGQLQMGGLAALVVALALPSWLPGALVIAICVLAGATAGMLWAGIAVALKAFRGANEVISTIMLNFIALRLIEQLVSGPLQAGDVYIPKTDPVPSQAMLPSLVPDTRLTWGIVIALVASVVTIWLVQRTTRGLQLRAIGLNREAARYAAVPVRRFWFGAFSASGALAGLAGALVVLGLRYELAPGWAPAWGFLGMLVAFLCLRTPWLIPVWGLLFGMLNAAGPILKSDASVPDAVVTITQVLPVVVLFSLYAAAGAWRKTRKATRGFKMIPRKVQTDA